MIGFFGLIWKFVCAAIGLLKLLCNLIKRRGGLQAQGSEYRVSFVHQARREKDRLEVQIEKRQSERLVLFELQQLRNSWTLTGFRCQELCGNRLECAAHGQLVLLRVRQEFNTAF